MMLIAAAAAAVLFASSAPAVLAGAPVIALAVPPMTVDVTADGVPPAMVARILAEADAIWRPSGVTFVWQRAESVVVRYARADETGPYVPKTLRLVIGDGRGTGGRNGRLPLGWIVFDDVTLPEPEIYLSHANAVQMMADSRGVIGIIGQMPIMQRETLLARAMGRSLAHELGHYLLASKAHTTRGLMKAILGASELFSPDASAFRVEPAQRRAVAARLRGEPAIVS